MATPSYDLLVIGSGPGGYTAAIRASQLGMKTACVEREPALGGTCLRIGCIPSKALLESSERFYEAENHLGQHGIVTKGVSLDLKAMHARKDKIVTQLTGGIAGLFKKNKVTHLVGHAAFVRAEPGFVEVRVGQETVSAKRVLIATGSREASLSNIMLDPPYVGSSTDALAYDAVPNHLVVIGAGAIGLELGSVWRRLGAKVTVLEYAPRILPQMDEELTREAQRIYQSQGLEFQFNKKVTGVTRDAEGAKVSIEGEKDVLCDRVLVAVGRVPNTEGLGLDALNIIPDKRGRISVGAHFETSVAGVFAIGDVVVGPMLAHKAEEEGVAAVEHMATGYGHVGYDSVAYIVYTEPEVASVGKTEEELIAAKVPYKKGKVPFLANGRARALANTQGFVKLLAHAETDRLLGAHIVGPRAGDLIVECATAIAYHASSEDIARTCHPHPTLSEVIRETALAVHKRTLNF